MTITIAPTVDLQLLSQYSASLFTKSSYEALFKAVISLEAKENILSYLEDVAAIKTLDQTLPADLISVV